MILKTLQQAMLALDYFGSVMVFLNQLQRDLAGTLSAYEMMWGEYFRGVSGDDGHRAPMSRVWSYKFGPVGGNEVRQSITQ